MDDVKKTAIQRWLIKANNDMVTARTMLTTSPPVTDTACFHAQQTVEKCLKAFLVYADIHVEKSHYLPRLVELCSRVDSSFREIVDIAIELTDYAVSDRYPDNWRVIPIDEAAETVKKAEYLMSFVRSKLNV
jgi:HEPN domain-containing protein